MTPDHNMPSRSIQASMKIYHGGVHFVTLDHFEGPLDLLLHLVKEQEMDIFKVNLQVLTIQYLEYLRTIEFADLMAVGSYVKMAAILLQIKSSSLLPTAPKDQMEEEEDPVAERMRLLARLEEHQTFKNAAEYLGGVRLLGEDKQPGGDGERWQKIHADTDLPLSEDPAVLCVLYEQMLTSLPQRQHARVVAKAQVLAIEQVMARLSDLLQVCGSLRFEDLYGGIPSRVGLVASIVSVLQLAAQQRIELIQEEPLSTLWMYRERHDSMVETVPTAVCSEEQRPGEMQSLEIQRGVKLFGEMFYS